MIDVLVFNPTTNANAVISFLKNNNLSYELYQAPNVLHAYDNGISVKQLGEILDSDRFTSVIAFSGFRWLDYFYHQISLSNLDISNAVGIDYSTVYGQSKNEVGGMSFNFLSYKGKHVLLDAFVFKQGKWTLFSQNQTGEYFSTRVNAALAFLDQCKVINGPSQVYVSPALQMNLLLRARTFAGRGMNKASTKAFSDIWPTVVRLESDGESNKAKMAFDIWAELNGPDNQFTVPVVGKT